MSVPLRKCRRCLKHKQAKSFRVTPLKYRAGVWKTYQAHICNACNNAAQVARKGGQAVVNKETQARRHARKLRAIEYKGGKCQHCDGVFHPAALDFHHVDPYTKDVEPGLMMGYRDEKLFAELDKCILLCANCHRIHHFKETEK